MRLASLAVAAVVLAISPALVRGDDPTPAGPAASAERIDGLVRQLGADDFRARESASHELEGIGEPARAALQKAKTESPSLEIRWRAEQLLRRLDGQGERSLDERAPGEGRGEAPRGEPGASAGSREMDRLRKMLEERFGKDFGRQMGRGFGDELRKQMEQGGFGFPVPFFDMSGMRRHVEVPGLALDVGPRGNVVLRIRDENGSGETVREGKSLDDILEKNPALKDHPGMADLKKRAEALKAAPGGFSFGGVFGQPGTTMFSSSAGVEIVQEPGKVKVTIRTKDAQGNDVPKTYEGTDLEQLKKDHPELREALGGFSLSFGPSFQAPQIFREGFLRGLDGWVREGREAEDEDATPGQTEDPQAAEEPRAARERARAPETAAGGIRFGVDVAPVEPILAYHLGIAEDRSALVMRVVPGSPAEAIGLQQHDVIVGVNGETPADFAAAAEALRAAARSKGPFSLDVIRAGKRMTLSR